MCDHGSSRPCWLCMYPAGFQESMGYLQNAFKNVILLEVGKLSPTSNLTGEVACGGQSIQML